MKYLKALLFFPLCWSTSSLAQTIEEIFPYTVQSHSQGMLNIHQHSSISGIGKKPNSGEVNFKSIDKSEADDSGKGKGKGKGNENGGGNEASCYGYPCVAPPIDAYQNTPKADLDLYGGKSSVEKLGNGSGYTVGNHHHFGGEEKIYIINGDFTVKPKGYVGSASNGALIFVKGNAEIKGQFHGYLYATGDVTIQTPHAGFCGRISSGNLGVKSHATIDSRGDCTFDYSWVDEEVKSILSASNTIGYVYGEDKNAAKIIIKNTGTATEQKFKLSYGVGALSYKKVGEAGTYTSLVNGSDYQLPLNTELYIKYNLPSLLNLTLDPKIEGQEAQSVNLKFVPYMVEVQPHTDCPQALNQFVYATHSGCPVLAKAGEQKSLPLSFVGYGINADGTGKGQKIEGYEFDTPNDNPVKINGISSSVKDGITFGKVDTIQASVDEHCASYAPKCGDKKTQGSSSTIGRTVPESLKAIATAGDIEGDVVYAGKSGVSFDTAPSFTVLGLDVNGNELTSYSGEFAGGLKGNTRLELDTALDLEVLAPTITETEIGKHVISVDTSKVKFIKTEPFAETELDLPLGLTINDHDGTQGVDDAKTTLAQKNDTLRFGFVTLMDTEVKVGEAGTMVSKLHYFGQDLQTLREDKDTGYDFAEASGVRHEPVPDPELKLGLVEHEVTVAPYDKQQKNIKVTIENLPVWLKPEQDGSLIDPEARLDILNQPRKRGNDSTFNRREVIR